MGQGVAEVSEFMWAIDEALDGADRGEVPGVRRRSWMSDRVQVPRGARTARDEAVVLRDGLIIGGLGGGMANARALSCFDRKAHFQ
jgi:hypothetical protein